MQRTEYRCMPSIVQGKVCKILARHEIKPHKVRYDLERRDETFEAKMAEALCVYCEVALLRKSPVTETNVAIISYDEKPGPGIQTIGSTASTPWRVPKASTTTITAC